VRRPVDALRSVAKHVAKTLGPDWEVRLSSERGSMQYPYAIVALVGPALSSRNTLHVQMTQPVTVYCYSGVESSAELSELAANEVEDVLWGGLVGSLEPYRVPLYDYAGVGLNGGSEARFEHDYLRLVDVQLNRVADDSDDNRTIVVCDFRATWHRPTDRLTALRGGRVLQSLRQTVVAEGAEQSAPIGGFRIEQSFGRLRAFIE